jgi:hypothetical protein
VRVGETGVRETIFAKWAMSHCLSARRESAGSALSISAAGQPCWSVLPTPEYRISAAAR